MADRSLPLAYLIRHASPDRSRTDLRYDVPPGPPLTPEGEDEAERLGRWLQAAGVAALWASPLERTRRTAELAAAAAGIPVVHDVAGLAEWVRGEAEAAVLERFRPVWRGALAEAEAGRPIGLVTHGGPIRALLRALGLGEDRLAHYVRQFDNGNPMPPAGVWRTSSAAGGGRWAVELVFSPRPFQPHLEGDGLGG